MNKTSTELYYVPFPDHTELVTHLYLKMLNVPLVAVASFVNLSVFMVILSTSSLRQKASVIFILSLTFADLLIAAIDVPLIIVVVEQVGQDPQRHCSLEWAIFYINWIACGASSLSLLAASLDRLVFVSFPFIYEEIVTAKRAFICVTLAWVGSIIVFCLAWLSNNGDVFAYQLFVLVLLLFVLVSYASVHLRAICVVRRLVTPVTVSKNCGEVQNANIDDDDSKATHTALVLILTFVICWMPMVIIGFIWASEYPKGYPKFISGHQQEKSRNEIPVVNELYFWFEFLAHFHCLLNPFVFTIKDIRIRTRIVSIVSNLLRSLKSNLLSGCIME